MINFSKTTLALSFVGLLAACGGGNQSESQQESQDKYAGTHSYCDGDHTRYRVTLTGTGNNNYKATSSEITYQNSNCTGTVLATYSEPLESTLTFIETATAPVSAPGLAPNLSIDKYKLNIPQQTATLIGPNVTRRSNNSSCFPVPPDRNFCYGLALESEEVDLGAYKTSAGFYLLLLENGTYLNEEGSVFVKE
jgi:hypothetical protein